MQTPRFEELAARDDVQQRETVHEVDRQRFEAVRQDIADGLSWAVGAVVTDDAGRVLLVRENDQWLAPGGKVEAGETHGEALVREVREETGITIAVAELVAVTEVAFEHDDERVTFSFAHYTATPETTTLAVDPGTDGEDIERVAWLDSVPEDTIDRDVVTVSVSR